MSKSVHMADTIAAIATPSGSGGIGIVRVSGPQAFDVLARIFVGKSRVNPSEWRGFSAHYGWIRDHAGTTLDEVLAVVMRAPKSYTAEDVVEINCHGGGSAVRAVLELCLNNGARLAEPGEFTKRAFLNGRIDLAQAEAVLDIVSAKTEAALRASEKQLKGDLSVELEAIRAALLSACAGLEALLNFPEEDTDAGQAGVIQNFMQTALERINALLASSRGGMILKDGLKIVICGKPNSGKSSLLNALLKTPRAIVTDVAGTTRDVIEEMLNLNGIPVRLLDTAGILSPRDRVEEEAIRRSRLAVDGADMILLVLDRSVALEDVDKRLLADLPPERTLIAVNKADQPEAWDMAQLGVRAAGVCKVSALTRAGLTELEALMTRLALGGVVPDGGVCINNLRHVEALHEARRALLGGIEGALSPAHLPCVAEEIRTAVRALDRITGRDANEDLVNEIFSRFCIGK